MLTNSSIYLLCISVKLKNLKANHNLFLALVVSLSVVYIRKVKKSESKSQQSFFLSLFIYVVYIRKVKKSESKSQRLLLFTEGFFGCVYP